MITIFDIRNWKIRYYYINECQDDYIDKKISLKIRYVDGNNIWYYNILLYECQYDIDKKL
jgi:hypothetical protein